MDGEVVAIIRKEDIDSEEEVGTIKKEGDYTSSFATSVQTQLQVQHLKSPVNLGT